MVQILVYRMSISRLFLALVIFTNAPYFIIRTGILHNSSAFKLLGCSCKLSTYSFETLQKEHKDEILLHYLAECPVFPSASTPTTFKLSPG